MGYDLKDLLAGVEVAQEQLHRNKKEFIRPDSAITLQSIAKESKVHAKTQKDPTDDLIELPAGCDEIVFTGEFKLDSYAIWDAHTKQTWYAHDEACLNKNFIYRDDLEIQQLPSIECLESFYAKHNASVTPGILTAKFCYILDIPGNETYEVYYESNYPSLKYGKATPSGMFVHKYANRFHRDMAILELDDLYTTSSTKAAAEITAKKFKQNEAIIISDGAWMKEVVSSAYYYIDAESVIKMCEGCLPSDKDQAVLISEIKAATNALLMCKARGKKVIWYYYDNTSILNIFRNRKMEYLDEVKKYKELCEELLTTGHKVTFIELHPKTDDNKDSLNKALTFFHNGCDSECRIMCDIVKKDYSKFAMAADRTGKGYAEVKQEFKPKGQPRGSYNNRKPNNNRR